MKNYKGLVVVVQQLQPMLQVAKEQTVDLLVQKVEAAVVGSFFVANYFFAAVLGVVLPFDVGWNCTSFVKDHNAAYAC